MGLFKHWKSYWFKPAPVLNLAVTRIVLVGLQLVLLMSYHGANAPRFVRLSRLPDSVYHPLPILKLLILPLGWDFRPSLGILLLIYGTTLATGILSFVGFKTNASLLLFALGNIFLQSFSYSFGDFHHPETVMMIALCCLAVSPAGKVLSVDELRQRTRRNIERGTLVSADIGEQESAFARWPLLLIQWFLAIVYLDAALSKLLRSGLDWMNGHTLQYYLFQDGLRRGSEIGVWLAHQHGLVLVLSWVTIIFECTFFLILIFRALTWVYLPVGVALHVGMCVARVACFYQYVAAYCVFIPWAGLLRKFRHPEGARGRAKLRVRYATDSPASLRTMTLLQYFDWLGLLVLVPEKVEPGYRHQDRARGERASRSSRRDSLRSILWRVPVLWPLFALSFLPGAPAAVGRFFKQIDIDGQAGS